MPTRAAPAPGRPRPNRGGTAPDHRPVKLLPTLDPCRWITDNVTELSAGVPATVTHCVPPVFPLYAKVFHAVHEDPSVRDRALTWHEAETRSLGPDAAPVEGAARSRLVYGGADRASRLVPIRWAELAGRYGIAFVPTLSSWSFTRLFPGSSWPRHLVGPIEASLTAPERDALVAVLRRHTAVDRVLFRFWVLATTDWGGGDKLWEGVLDDVASFPDEALGARTTPSHWFPEDRRWLVCTDYDLTFTLVGGSEALIRDLLDHPVLECVPVRPETRIDGRAEVG